MKIYTRKGDTGTTQLIGGTRVPKHHVRIEAYGTVDELNSWIGLLRTGVLEGGISIAHATTLQVIQDRLFTMGSSLASDPEKSKMKIPVLNEGDVELLEKEIDKMDQVLPEMKSFVLPGGSALISHCHIARCVCRRAERIAVHLSEESTVEPLVLKYLNRLSDYLFTLSRDISRIQEVVETPWVPRK